MQRQQNQNIMLIGMYNKYIRWTCSEKSENSPIEPFTILEPQNPSIDDLYVVRKRPLTNFDALKLQKGNQKYKAIS